jgi:hypothetical protein
MATSKQRRKGRAASAEPSEASLRAMPEIDFNRCTLHRNPFAKRVQAEGIELVHDGPSTASLAELPEVELAPARRNPYAHRILTEGIQIQLGKGRPRRGEEVGPTTPRSIRLPAAVWETLEELASERNETVHSVLRAAVGLLLEAATMTLAQHAAATVFGARWERMSAEGEASAPDTKRLRSLAWGPIVQKLQSTPLDRRVVMRVDRDAEQLRHAASRVLQDLQ